MGKAIILRVDGSVEELDHRPTLEEAQKIVGGYIEIVRSTLDKNKTLIIDEEGKCNQKLFNPRASELYIHSPIVGDVIVLEGWKTVGG